MGIPQYSARGMRIVSTLSVTISVLLLTVCMPITGSADQVDNESGITNLNATPKVVPEFGIGSNGAATTTSVMNSDGNTTVETSSSPSATGPGGCTLVPIKGGKLCYFWAGATQPNIKASGASVEMLQSQPKVGAHDDHSIAELWVASADSKQIIEVGWLTLHTHPKPYLWVYHWVNGKGTCYNGCGFVPTHSSGISVGDTLKVGGPPVTYSIQYSKAASAWLIGYNGHTVGRFPASLWKGKFKQLGNLQIFGEVGASSAQLAKTQMGNGKLGSHSGPAYFKDLKFFNSPDKPDIQKSNLYEPGTKAAQKAYDYGAFTNNSLHYGGPGF